MEFFLLGPAEARVGDRLVSLGRRRERLLLGVLLLEPGRPITIDRLVDLLWDDDPAPGARASLHSHVARPVAYWEGQTCRQKLVSAHRRPRSSLRGDRVSVGPATLLLNAFPLWPSCEASPRRLNLAL